MQKQIYHKGPEAAEFLSDPGSLISVANLFLKFSARSSKKFGRRRKNSAPNKNYF
jgi:hypothetical protein